VRSSCYVDGWMAVARNAGWKFEAPRLSSVLSGTFAPELGRALPRRFGMYRSAGRRAPLACVHGEVAAQPADVMVGRNSL
jgi:hypothetical protein